MTESFVTLKESGQTIGDAYTRMDKLAKGELRNQLRSALNAATKEARTEVRDMERGYLPAGLRKQYAKVPTESVRVNGKGVTVKWLQKRSRSDLQSMDQGVIRHPLFGNRHRWYDTNITPGMWSDSVQTVGPGVVDAASETLVSEVETYLHG